MINILKTLRSNPDFFGELDFNRPSTISSIALSHTPVACANKDVRALPLRQFMHPRYRRGERSAAQIPPQPKSALTREFGRKVANNTIADNPQHARLLRFIENNIVNDWSLEYYARSVGMSLSTFRRVFHEVFDEPSPKAWLVRQRLRYAHAKLKHTNTNILDIAFDCGFSSQSYFTQAYKKRYGVAPSMVRKKNL